MPLITSFLKDLNIFSIFNIYIQIIKNKNYSIIVICMKNNVKKRL